MEVGPGRQRVEEALPHRGDPPGLSGRSNDVTGPATDDRRSTTVRIAAPDDEAGSFGWAAGASGGPPSGELPARSSYSRAGRRHGLSTVQPLAHFRSRQPVSSAVSSVCPLKRS
jgi:hypothetical protein